MNLVVQKFGGTSVADRERLFHVASIVTQTYEQGNNVVVVVSAQGDTTDDLIEKASEVNRHPSARELDMLLSTGEQISISLLAMAIEALGFPVISLTGWQAGFQTTSSHGKARIDRIDTERIANELAKRNIVVVAGFQGLSKYDDITTLGRGGSDTSAVALAAALEADVCQIYTDVDGVYTADPRIVPGAQKLSEITFDEMIELASLGAQVLQSRAVEMAMKYNVELEVLSSMQKLPGTKVKEVVTVEKMLIRGVACDDNVARISVIGVPDTVGMAAKIFMMLASKKINVDIILQTVSVGGKKDISFTVTKEDREQAMELLQSIQKEYGIDELRYDEDVAKVSIVGSGMQSNPGVAATLFDALASADVNIQLISTSEIKISVLVEASAAKRAINAIHSAFFE
ncbi:MAG TPA: aspartate kinase [Firmicutes bacterium]|nr:aspartate kinase [Bacillota bacterium]